MLPEEQSPVPEEDIVGAPETGRSSFLKVVVYIAAVLGLLAILVGLWFGVRYIGSLTEDTAQTPVEQFDFTEEELRTAESGLRTSLQSEFGLAPSWVGSKSLYLDGDHVMRREGETLHNIHVSVHAFPGVLDSDGSFVASSSMRDFYESKSKIVTSNSHGSVLVGANIANDIPFVSWVTYDEGVPLIIITHFNAGEISTSELETDFDANAPLIITAMLEAHPSDKSLTERLGTGISMTRSRHRGYASTEILSKDASPSGNTFILTIFKNDQSLSNSCDMFVDGDWLLEDAQRLISCELEITTADNTLVYTDDELLTVGGLPREWASANEIITSREEGSNESMGPPEEPWYEITGLFNTDTVQYREVLRVEHPAGWYWERALIEYQSGGEGERFLFVEDANGYLLYRVPDNAQLNDLFVADLGAGYLVDYLNPAYKSQIELVGALPASSKLTVDAGKYGYSIDMDQDKNIAFIIGVHSDSPKEYIYERGVGLRELDVPME